MAKTKSTKNKSSKVKVIKNQLTDLDSKTAKKFIKDDKVVVVNQPEGKYLVTIYMQDKVYSQRTDNIAESILSLKPEKITNKIRIVVEEDKKKAERIFFVYPARRLFQIPLATEFFVKNITLALK